MLKRNTLGAGLGAAAGVHGYWSGSSLAGRHFSRISTPQSAPIAGRHTVDPGSGRGERTHAAMRKDLDETRACTSSGPTSDAEVNIWETSVREFRYRGWP